MKQRGSILVGVLWCMVLLSVLVIGVLHTARMDLLVVKNYGDRVQAHYLALAGVERAKALIYQDLVARQGAGKNHTGILYNDPKDFQNVSLGRGKFQVFRRAPQGDGGDIVYGISDEESRLNVNTAPFTQLTNLPELIPDMAKDIVAWRSPANPTTAPQDPANSGGANSDFYLGLPTPYMPRNGPFQTVRELLMVRNVTTNLLMGNDDNQNGFLDSDDDPADQAPPGSKPPPSPNPGWYDLLTVTDMEDDVDAAGNQRVNVKTADENTLTTVAGITRDIARAIIASRNQLNSLDDLLNVTAQNQNQGGAPNRPGGGNQSGGQNGSGNSGPTLISQDLLEQIADHLTLGGGSGQEGMINVNTASLDVLICLPGVERPLAQEIINYRKTSGYFDSVAALLKVSGMTRAIFKQLAPLVTVRSETYRIICEGKINSSGVRQRIEEMVHIGRKDMKTLGYREDL